ncbi:MAG: hypothetical protein M1118_04910 [Chloroflexi bacterium]|nr:hypothetical protein [Chloroflexota bacterium]
MDPTTFGHWFSPPDGIPQGRAPLDFYNANGSTTGVISVHRLIWDSGNVAHIARHGVTLEEVEQVCHGTFIVRQAALGRLMLIGPTLEGRMLAAVLDPEPDEPAAYYPVTAPPGKLQRPPALPGRARR